MFGEDMTSKEFVKQVAVEIYKEMLSDKDKNTFVNMTSRLNTIFP